MAAASVRASALAGDTVEPPYESAGNMARRSHRTPDPRIAELLMRSAKDQAWRAHFAAALQRLSWADGLSDNARGYAFKVVSALDCDIDERNTNWLKDEIRRNGWFDIRRFGREADQATWLIVQHADKDRAFQRQILTVLDPLVASGATNPTNYAYLYDRVAVGAGQPQRFGTQGRCVKPGAWEPFPVEAQEQLDDRRTAVGLGSESEYVRSMVRLCPG